MKLGVIAYIKDYHPDFLELYLGEFYVIIPRYGGKASLSLENRPVKEYYLKVDDDIDMIFNLIALYKEDCIENE